jgi:predicted unusual protein kinase regulating ubiquinone biosynthesis (AarF/ABC1/UbiB family)
MQNLNNPPSTSVSSETEKVKSNGHLNGNGAVHAAEYSNGREIARPRPQPFSYDVPHSIDEARQKRPKSLKMQWRFLRSIGFAAWIFAQILFWRVIVQRIAGKEFVDRGDKQRWRKWSRSFRHFAIDMGGLMIKLGQFISTRVDALPLEITEELVSLQDEVPSVPFEQIREVIERNLGPISERYSWFNQEPVAAASLGQVHRARLLNGDRVVVKVQRPGIADIIYTDLAALAVVAKYAKKYPPIARRADTEKLTEEFGRVLLEELSYEHEAQNARQFAEMFKNNMGVYVPSIYAEHSTDHVLTIEDVTSIKINDYAALEAAGISRKAVAKRLMDTYLIQIFERHFFHADPHPGNLFVYPLPVEEYKPGQRPFYLIFIDFGMTGQLTQKIVDGLIDTMAAVVSRDARKLIESYDRLGLLLPSADKKRLEEATTLVFDQVWGRSMAELGNMDYDQMAEMGKEFNDLIYEMPFQMPQDWVYLSRAVGILSGMCTDLDPTFNPWHEMQPYTQKLVAQTITGSNGAGGLGLPVLQGLFSGTAAQTLLDVGQTIITRTIAPQSGSDALLQRLDRGDVQITVDPSSRYRYQLARLETQSRKTTRAILFGSLLVSSTLLYTSGSVTIAVVGYVLSGVAFLSMVFTSEIK